MYTCLQIAFIIYMKSVITPILFHIKISLSHMPLQPTSKGSDNPTGYRVLLTRFVSPYNKTIDTSGEKTQYTLP